MFKLFHQRPKLLATILTILMLAIIVMSSGRSSGKDSGLTFVGDAMTPLQSASSATAGFISNIFSKTRNINELNARIEELEQENLELQGMVSEYNEVYAENERLYELLEFSDTIRDVETIAARVTGKTGDAWFNIITLNRGKNHGVGLDMAVVSSTGLVGRVVEVGNNWCRVLCLIDDTCSVSALVERTRDNGMVQGSNSSIFNTGNGLLNLVYLPLTSNLEIGDRVMTSSLGDIFPKGIYIGEIVDITIDQHNFYQKATISPGADFQRLEEVMIVYIPDDYNTQN